MESRNWLQLTLLLVAAVASGVLLMRNTSEPIEQLPPPRLDVGYYMTDAELIVTGANGQTLYRVRTDNANENRTTGVIDLDKVYVEYDPRSSVPWNLRADTGHIPPDRNIIELEGNVVAKTSEDENPPITIYTDFLELNTDTYIAATEQKVAIDYATNRVLATGMRAYLKEDRIQLLTDVNGSFAPQTINQ